MKTKEGKLRDCQHKVCKGAFAFKNGKLIKIKLREEQLYE